MGPGHEYEQRLVVLALAKHAVGRFLWRQRRLAKACYSYGRHATTIATVYVPLPRHLQCPRVQMTRPGTLPANSPMWPSDPCIGCCPWPVSPVWPCIRGSLALGHAFQTGGQQLRRLRHGPALLSCTHPGSDPIEPPRISLWFRPHVSTRHTATARAIQPRAAIFHALALLPLVHMHARPLTSGPARRRRASDATTFHATRLLSRFPRASVRRAKKNIVVALRGNVFRKSCTSWALVGALGAFSV